MTTNFIKASKLIANAFYNDIFKYSLNDNGFGKPATNFEIESDIDNLSIDDIIRFSNHFWGNDCLIYVKLRHNSINKTFTCKVNIYDINNLNNKIATFELFEINNIYKLTKKVSSVINIFIK